VATVVRLTWRRRGQGYEIWQRTMDRPLQTLLGRNVRPRRRPSKVAPKQPQPQRYV
jgi:hypothetical protein